MQVSEQVVFIEARDGVRLAATLYLPFGDGPFATLMEALPYRMDDITSSYADSYQRFAAEGSFAVLRLDLRGTGSSGGHLPDEYSDIERDDLTDVIRWIAAQAWSTGRVGMFGTSYSGFNSLHMAMDGVPELGAIVAMYATDDRYTDDVHYCGGVLRALDLIDYPLYMVAMNALPPVPARWGDDWADEWRARVERATPWILEWLRRPNGNDPVWRRGSVRLGPGGLGYDRISCPTMLIAGWADGYRNNTFRTVEALEVPWRLLAGPWVHKDPSTARPAPNVDSDREIMAFFHEHLRGGPASAGHRAQVFVRRPTPPAADLAFHEGSWVEFDHWPVGVTVDTRLVDSSTGSVDELVVRGDTGMYAWNSCAGGLPWGQPLDQRLDNDCSITHDWPNGAEQVLMGHADVRLRVRSSATVGHLSVKLCDVAPDGTSTLITRGMLDLQQVGCWPADAHGTLDGVRRPLVPGAWADVDIEFEATTWTLVPGHVLRLAIAGTDWPNCWPPAEPFTLGVDRSSIVLSLPVADVPASTHAFGGGPGPSDGEREGVVWRYEHDVVGRESRVVTRYGGHYDGVPGIEVDDLYEGELGISTIDLGHAWARGRSRFDLTLQTDRGATVCTTEARLYVVSDRDAFHVELTLVAEHDGVLIGERTWTESLPR